jgi:hypothetical protein
MLKKISLAVLALVAVFLVYVATRPAAFKVERSAHILAPAAVVFAHVNDLRQWGAWSPWEKLDPGMARDFAGPASGPGASYHWKSANDNVGEGSMTIVASRPAERIAIKLEFMAPFKATNDTVFSFQPAGGATHVTWAMSGHNNFVGKLMQTVLNMDKMVGGDFEKGLAALKSVSEAQAPAPPAAATTATAPVAAPR